MSNVGVTVIPLPEPSDEVYVPLESDRVIHVGDWESRAFFFGDHFLTPDLFQPSGMVWLVSRGRAAHNPERQRLPRVMSFL
jgi:hypothetical protein